MTTAENLKVGVIGAGWWATTNHIPELAKRADVKLAAVCRLGRDLLGEIQQTFGFPFATEDYHELLEQPLDAVVIASPHHLHYEHARAALERGCHVLIEKPMTLDPRQAWELVELAERRNLTLMLPYGWHYKSFTQEAFARISAGDIGKIEYALCHMASPWKSFLDPQMRVMSQWTPSLAAPDPATWQVKANGGGYAHGQITHSAALLFWLTGLRATEVSCRMTAPHRAVDEYNAAHVLFDNGAIGTLSGAANLVDDDPFQVDLRIFGSEGVLLLDVERERMQIRRHDGRHYEARIPAGEGAYSCEGPPHRFIEVIRGQGRNDSSGYVGAATVELIAAMFDSAAQKGTPVRVTHYRGGTHV